MSGQFTDTVLQLGEERLIMNNKGVLNLSEIFTLE